MICKRLVLSWCPNDCYKYSGKFLTVSKKTQHLIWYWRPQSFKSNSSLWIQQKCWESAQLAVSYMKVDSQGAISSELSAQSFTPLHTSLRFTTWGVAIVLCAWNGWNDWKQFSRISNFQCSPSIFNPNGRLEPTDFWLWEWVDATTVNITNLPLIIGAEEGPRAVNILSIPYTHRPLAITNVLFSSTHRSHLKYFLVFDIIRKSSFLMLTLVVLALDLLNGWYLENRTRNMCPRALTLVGEQEMKQQHFNYNWVDGWLSNQLELSNYVIKYRALLL